MLMQLHSTFLWYLNVSNAQYRMTLLSKAMQKYLFYL